MADIKTLLKDARKLLDDKNYIAAQECCKNILRKDKQNYIGLVFLGKALQDSEQAPLAYQKAIANKPDNPLAWQGLACFYESKNTDTDKTKLIAIYNEMLKLQLEEEKTLEVIKKLGEVGCALKNTQCLKILTDFLDTNSNKKISKLSESYFINMLKADVPCNEQDIPVILKVLNRIYDEDPTDSLEMLQCKVIIQKSNFASAIEEIIHLNYFRTNFSIREWLCKQLCIKYVNEMSFSEFNIEKNLNTIIDGVTNSKYPNLLQSMITYDKGLYVEAYKQCIPLVNYHEANVTEALFIIKCTVMLKKWSITQKLTVNFLAKVRDKKFTVVLQNFLILSLYKQQKWKQAIDIANNVPVDLMKTEEIAIVAECYIEAYEPADHLMKLLETSKYYDQLHALLLIQQEKYNEVFQLFDQTSDNPIHLFYLGKAYWKTKQYNNCIINLLKAAKLNPNHADTFFYLGHFYYNHKGDLEKARKCYEKAYVLNPIHCNIVKQLSEVYIKLEKKDENFEILKEFTKNVTTVAPWANFRLGIHYLNKREWENAILNLKIVIKNDLNNATAFECLADAYYSRGSFSSALRVYNKVMLLDPHKTAHCLTRIGFIHSLLTQYDEAIKAFEEVFKIDPYSSLALLGIAETWTRVAKKKANSKLYGSARESAQLAIDYVIKALSKQRKFLCFWKLLADNLIFVTKLPNKYAFIYMPELNRESGANDQIMKNEKLDLFSQAIACYSHITKQRHQIASYDLASAYLAYYYETKKNKDCLISFHLTINCIKERPTLWRQWNLLGKICLCLEKYEIAQHCFIRALSVTRKWSVVKIWCNLGALYLKLKLYRPANYCFWRGQSMLPSYPQSWIGQALIAEVIREDEAMDLFRHASRLGYHPESALGYADWVCRALKNNKYKENTETLYEIEQLHAVPYAIDLMEWFCNFEPENSCAYNILGILQERHGIIKSAIQSYEMALKCAENEKRDIILLNIGRIMIILHNYDDAINTFKSITEASFESTVGLALALYRKGLYEESYSAYDTALQWLSTNDIDKADLLVVMAGIVYMFKGADDAKTLLFHSIQVSSAKPTAHSLFAICALGLIHSDHSLSKLALSELEKYEKDYIYGFDIGFLKSYLFISEGNMKDAIRILSDCLHDHPDNAMTWFYMAQYYLRFADKMAKVASSLAQRALNITNYNQSECNAAKIMASVSIAEHLSGDQVKSTLMAKIGLHKYPSNPEIWVALLFSLLSNSMSKENKRWLLEAVGQIRKHLNISRPISRWIILMEKKLNK